MTYAKHTQSIPRDILFLDVVAFRVEVERVRAPRLRGRPVAIALPHSARSVLIEVSREARAEGLAEGMPLGVAMRVCRRLIVVPPDPGLYERAARAVVQLVTHFTPLWEQQQPGRVYLDLSGGRRLFGPPRDVAWRIEKDLESGLALRGSLGIAANKLVSRIAARTVPPRGILDIERGIEAPFLSPLSVHLLPGIGKVRLQTLLDELNVKRIGELAAVPMKLLRGVFGVAAETLHQRAIGLDIEPVRLPERRSASEDEIALAEDTNDDRVLLGALYSVVERIAARMRAAGQRAAMATFTVSYSDGVEVSRQVRLEHPSFWDFDLYRSVERLYFKATGRRTRVRQMKVSFEHAKAATGGQLEFDFSDAGDSHKTNLIHALDRVRDKHGYEAVQFGRTAANEGRRRCA